MRNDETAGNGLKKKKKITKFTLTVATIQNRVTDMLWSDSIYQIELRSAEIAEFIN